MNNCNRIFFPEYLKYLYSNIFQKYFYTTLKSITFLSQLLFYYTEIPSLKQFNKIIYTFIFKNAYNF